MNVFANFLLVPAVIGELCAIIVAPSVCLSYLLEWLLKERLTRAERWNISCASGLLLLPLLLLLETALFGIRHHSLPLLNALVIIALTVSVSRLRRKLKQTIIQPSLWRVPWPLFLAGLICVGLITVVVTTFQAVPDLDPHTWWNHYQHMLLDLKGKALPDRALFVFLVYLLQQGAGIDTFVVFKYAFPFLAISSLLPLWLLTRSFSTTWEAVLFLLMVIAVPSTFHYHMLAMPQSIIITITYFFFGWLLYSQMYKRSLFYYGAGSIAAIGFLFHEMALALIIVWLVVTLITDGPRLLAWVRKHIFQSLLVVLIVASNASHFRDGPLAFLRIWLVNNILPYFHFEPNWRFPAHYINVDNLSPGWPGWSGVMKYYAFFVGPLLLGLLVLNIGALIKSGRYRRFVGQQLFWYRESIIIVVLFMFFVAIAELLPRFANIAFLPERAWIFTGIFGLWFFVPLHNYAGRFRRWLLSGMLVLLLVSASGIMYINYLKGYSIPNQQVRAATWIRKHLPPDRVILASGHTNLLSLYSESAVIDMPPAIYCDATPLDDELIKQDQVLRQRLLAHHLLVTKQIPLPDNGAFFVMLEQLQKEHPTLPPYDAFKVITSYANSQQLISTTYEERARQHTYIFYGNVHPRHLYARRPYGGPVHLEDCPHPVLDKYPSQFKKLYDDHGTVMIWEWLQ